MYIMDHETISYKTLIQELSVQYESSHSVIQKSTNTCANSLPLDSLPPMRQSLQWMNESSTARLHMLMGISTVCVIA
jgi:hypothetical protein